MQRLMNAASTDWIFHHIRRTTLLITSCRLRWRKRWDSGRSKASLQAFYNIQRDTRCMFCFRFAGFVYTVLLSELVISFIAISR